MAARKLKVIVTRKLPDPVETRMCELFDTELNVSDKPMTADELVDAMSRADVLVPTITDRIDSRLLSRSGDRLKLIANFGAGVDNIDVATANARGIIVTNTPGVLTEDTADLTMTLIMAASRRIVEGAEVVKAGGFHGWSPTWMLGRRLWGKRLGIIGMGRIGQAIARRSLGFDMQVLYHNRSRLAPEQEARANNARYVSKQELLQQADHVVLVLPYSKDTHHTIAAPELALMKPTATLTNIARGGIVDEVAVAEALRQGRLGGAALDVFDAEPLKQAPHFEGCPNLVLTPHIAGVTTESNERVSSLIADKVLQALAEAR